MPDDNRIFLAAIEAEGYNFYKDMVGPQNLGGWPMIQKEYNSSGFSWEVASGLSRSYLNLGLILTTFVFLDTFDASQNVIHVSQTL